MAGAIAQGVIGSVTEMIVQQTAQEAALVCNFTRDFIWLKKRLTTLSGGLKSVCSLSTKDEDVKEWLDNHLNIKDCHYGLRSNMQKGISKLSSLRVLRSNELRLSVEDDGLLKLDVVSKLTHLQEIS
ncbi:hypothetical protein SUGI_0351740 [Cryptomeria japonica]|nr:hypothetical protein SUGI_0351740 [Cryptomeria japonica]